MAPSAILSWLVSEAKRILNSICLIHVRLKMSDLEKRECEEKGQRIASVKIDEIIFNPNHPRKSLNNLDALAESIKMVGVLQPILIQKDGNDKIHLIAGERRVRAAEMAGKTEIPALFIDPKAKANFISISLIENIHKSHLTPLEEAEALQRLKSEYMFSNRLMKPIAGKSEKELKEIWQINSLSNRVKEFCRENESLYGKVVAKGTLIRIVRMEDDDDKIAELDKFRYRWPRTKEEIAKDRIKGLNKTLVNLNKRENQGSRKHKIENELYDLAGKIRELVAQGNERDQQRWNRVLRELQNQIASNS